MKYRKTGKLIRYNLCSGALHKFNELKTGAFLKRQWMPDQVGHDSE
ncbi:MAG: hypothetical protein JW927_22050 [Deltaproteobacteria bacterium]|nr:hypothetical protein [Deltaproteobacteria bacterium]